MDRLSRPAVPTHRQEFFHTMGASFKGIGSLTDTVWKGKEDRHSPIKRRALQILYSIRWDQHIDRRFERVCVTHTIRCRAKGDAVGAELRIDHGLGLTYHISQAIGRCRTAGDLLKLIAIHLCGAPQFTMSGAHTLSA